MRIEHVSAAVAHLEGRPSATVTGRAPKRGLISILGVTGPCSFESSAGDAAAALRQGYELDLATIEGEPFGPHLWEPKAEEPQEAQAAQEPEAPAEEEPEAQPKKIRVGTQAGLTTPEELGGEPAPQGKAKAARKPAVK